MNQIKTVLSLLIGFTGFFANAADIKVLIIDTGISFHPKLVPYIKYERNINYYDDKGHGTHVAGIVAYGNHKLDDPLCNKVKLYSCNYHFDATGLNRTLNCLNYAISEKMDYINYSSGGLEFSLDEYNLLMEYTDKGGIAIVAAGNEQKELTDKTPYFPASYSLGGMFTYSKTYFRPIKGITFVQGMCGPTVCPYSNWSSKAKQENGDYIYSTLPHGEFGMMRGTSMATPQYLHNLLKLKCKGAK